MQTFGLSGQTGGCKVPACPTEPARIPRGGSGNWDLLAVMAATGSAT